VTDSDALVARPVRPVTDLTAGLLLAQRYRLVAVVSERRRTQLWRAVDEVLGRSVGVVTVLAVDPRAPALLAAARRAATVTDQHFLRVYDAGTAQPDAAAPVAFVVQEWVSARSLTNLLAAGPIDPHRAALVSRELAEAVAVAHTQGMAHRMLNTDCVLVSATGAVRIVGLGTAAALADLPGGAGPPAVPAAGNGTPDATVAAAVVAPEIRAADGAGPGATDGAGRNDWAAQRLADVRAVGGVFYASLTGRWPGAQRPWGRPGATGTTAAATAAAATAAASAADQSRPAALLPAPSRHNRVLGPRQVRPGIPRAHDVLALRFLGADAGPLSGSVTSARQVAGMLGEVTTPTVDATAPLPQLRDLAAGASGPGGESRVADFTDGQPPPGDPLPGGTGLDEPPPGRHGRSGPPTPAGFPAAGSRTRGFPARGFPARGSAARGPSTPGAAAPRSPTSAVVAPRNEEPRNEGPGDAAAESGAAALGTGSSAIGPVNRASVISDAAIPPGTGSAVPGGPGDPALQPAADGRRVTGVRLAAGSVLAMFAVGAGLLIWQAGTFAQDGRDGGVAAVRDAHVAAGPQPPPSPAAAVAAAGLPLTAVREFDPAGTDPRAAQAAGLAVDGDPGTVWRTARYRSPTVAGSGVGLLVDLGRIRTVSAVELSLLGSGSAVQLRSPGIAASPPPDLSAYGVLASRSQAGTEVRLRPGRPVLLRYLVIWFTGLPADGDRYRGGIRTLTVRG